MVFLADWVEHISPSADELRLLIAHVDHDVAPALVTYFSVMAIA